MLNPETLTILDPACGSGHILVEAYDILKDIYLERGYRLRDIPRLILEKNIFGLDIDDRAAQLAGFALLMKARADDRNILKNPPKLNILSLQSSEKIKLPLLWHHLNLYQKSKVGATSSLFEEPQLDLTNALELQQYSMVQDIVILFEQAKTFGALIQIPRDYAEAIAELLAQCQQLAVNGDNLQKIAATTLMPFLEQAKILTMQFDVVVANPPYMGGKGMNPALKEFAKKQFPDSKSDLFAMFMERCLDFGNDAASLSFVTPYVWMFISSYEGIRTKLLNDATLQSLIQLEYNAFEPACVPVCTFIVGKTHIPNYTGSYIKLSDFKGHESQAPKTLEAIKNPDCDWFYNAKPDDFKKISGSPIAYWVSDKVRDIFANSQKLDDVVDTRQGLSTADNDRFLRLWHEVDINNIGFGMTNRKDAKDSSLKWFPHNKGGEFRKWYGNNECVVNWENDGEELEAFKPKSVIRNPNYYFRPAITWSDVTSSSNGFRYCPEGFIPNTIAPVAYTNSSEDLAQILLFSNTNFASWIVKILNPTMHFHIGYFGLLPYTNKCNFDSATLKTLIGIAKTDWNNYETSWDFTENPLIRQKQNTQQGLTVRPELGACRTVEGGTVKPLMVRQAHHERLNLNHHERLNLNTIEQCFNQWQTQNRAAIVEMKRLEEENNRLFIEAYGLQDELSPDVPEEQITLVRADREKDSQRLISYAIGCMMGRYSLNEAGLIYAHAGNVDFDPAHYQTFAADDDGIVPMTDEFWFENDVAKRLHQFLGAVWGEETQTENSAWLADSLGRKNNEFPDETLRRYLANNFYKDHLQTYKKRPIYWLFSSGKQGAFQALVYLHRYNDSTLAKMRNNYVVPLLGKLQNRLEMLEQDRDAATSPASKNKIGKDIERFNKKKFELSVFDEKLRHYADLKIQLDLDDGVKVNYGKFGDLLAEVKAVTGGSGDE